MVGFTEGTYSDEKRLKNRLAIIVTTLSVAAVLLLTTLMTDWPTSNAIASIGVVLAFGAALWWMFGSKKAGPVAQTAASKDLLKRTYMNRKR